jgi:hypothetical protein
MTIKERQEFNEFLSLPKLERIKLMTEANMHWWERVYVRWVNRWWTNMLKTNSRMEAIEIWESIRKDRW